MNKLFLLFLLTIGLFFNSCNKKENESMENVDLLGTWTLIAYIDDEGEELADECYSQDSLTFMENNTFNYTYYYNYGKEGGCQKIQDATGSWEYLTDKIIKFDYSHGDYIDKDKWENPFEISGDILTLTRDEGLGIYLEKYKKKKD